MRARSPWLTLAAGVAVLVMASGCTRLNEGIAPPAAPESPAFSNYWGNRLYDFMDLFRFEWGVPRDFRAGGATFKATALAQVGFVYFEGKKVGLERRAVGIIRQDKIEGGVTPVYYSCLREAGEFGNYFMRTDTDWAKVRDRRIIRNGFFWSDGTGRPWAIGAEVELLCLGGPDVQFYICEFADFVVGWVGMDPRGDDVSRLVHADLDNQYFDGTPPKPLSGPETKPVAAKPVAGIAAKPGDVEARTRDLENQLKARDKEIADLKARLSKMAEVRTEGEKIIATLLGETYFKSGKADLLDEGKKEIDRVVGIVKDKYGDREISVRGYTDTDPIKYSGWKSNWELGSARALAVLHYIMTTHGIKGEQISASTFGEFRQVGQDKGLNRRVEIVILPKAGVTVEKAK